RFEERGGPRTRLWFVTEGVFGRLLAADPFLERVGVVVLDEFHERHLQGDVALAVVREVQETVRPDLRLAVMSATLEPDALAHALRPGPHRRIILATNVAETALTVEGVTAVIDSGLARVARLDPRHGINVLRVQPISRAAADQRAGRAGRLAPGRCLRLWSRAGHAGRRAPAPPARLPPDPPPPAPHPPGRAPA